MERKGSLIGTNKVTTFGDAPARRTTMKNEIYYSVTASSLSKLPLGEIYSSKQKKGRGEKSAAMKPSTKKAFFNVSSRIDTGVKKSVTTTQGQRQSDGLTSKRKDELYGRLSSHALAKFLKQKYTQTQFITKLKRENQMRLDDRGSDFNFVDTSYPKSIAHDIRLNKRPLTAKPEEKFGQFTQSLFGIDNTSAGKKQEDSLQALLSLEKQNVILVDMRGEGVHAQKEFNDFHIVGSVSFPHCWLNRYNHFAALERFKNLDDKVIIVFMDNERRGTHVAKVLTEKGFGNIYLLTGGLQQFFVEYPDLIDGYDIPDYFKFKEFVENNQPSPLKGLKK